MPEIADGARAEARRLTAGPAVADGLDDVGWSATPAGTNSTNQPTGSE